MSIEVEVMYADLSRQRVPLAEADSLSRDGVLFIILSAPADRLPRKDGKRRVMQAYGDDYYFLLREPGRFMLEGWSERDWTWKYERDPFKVISFAPGPPGLPDGALIFVGKQIDEDTWHNKAIPLFDAEMH